MNSNVASVMTTIRTVAATACTIELALAAPQQTSPKADAPLRERNIDGIIGLPGIRLDVFQAVLGGEALDHRTHCGGVRAGCRPRAVLVLPAARRIVGVFSTFLYH